MKEQKKFDALNAGLGNGLIFRNGKEGCCTDHLLLGLFTKSIISDYFEPFVVDEFDNEFGLDNVKSHLFSFDHLTKPMRIEGYNNGEEFVPIIEILKIEHKTYFNDHKKGKYSETEYAKDGNYAKAWVKFHAIKSTTLHTAFIWNFPKWVIEMLNKWHFNVEELPTDQFIDAAESKVYEPK